MSAIANILTAVLQRDDPGGRDHTGWTQGGINGTPGVFSNYSTSSGEVVNEKTALLVGAHFACVRCKSEDLSMLPCEIFELDDNRERMSIYDDPAWGILNTEFNPEMSAPLGKEVLFAHAIAFKKGIAQIEWANQAKTEPRHLWPLDPTRVEKFRSGGNIYHRYTDEGGNEHVLPDADVIELIGPSYDGRIGYSLAEMTKYVIGIALAAQKFQGSFFGNGAWLGGVIEELPKGLKPEAIEQMRLSFATRHQTAGRAFGVGIVPGGGKFKEVGADPQRGQVPQLLSWSVEEICRFHRVPPHKVQDYSNAHYNNVEQGEIVYRGDALMPLGIKFEVELRRKALRTGRYARINYNALQRVDFKTQMEGLAIGRMWGLYTINDALKKIGEDPIEGEYGDMRLIPANMIPIERAYEQRDQQSTNAKSPASKPDPSSSLGDMKKAYMPLVADGLRRAATKEERAMERIRKKGAGHEAEANAFYDKHRMYVASCAVPALATLARVTGLDMEGSRERLEMVGSLYAAEWCTARPGAEGPISEEFITRFAARWIDATLAATVDVDTQ